MFINPQYLCSEYHFYTANKLVSGFLPDFTYIITDVNTKFILKPLLFEYNLFSEYIQKIIRTHTKSMKTEIKSLSFGGAGIGYINGKVVFVENALPDEIVELQLIQESKNYSRAVATNIIKKSDFRINPVCLHYKKCGGCQYLHLRYENEVSAKLIQLQDILERIGGFKNCKINSCVSSDKNLNYRNSVTFHKSRNGYGFYSKDNKSIIDVDYCYLINSQINDYIKNIIRYNNKSLKIKTDFNGNIYLSNNKTDKYFIVKYFNEILYFSVKSFSQTNNFITEKIISRINNSINDYENCTLFDLYSGAGLFSFLIKKNFKKIIAIENDRYSINAAYKNKKEHKKNNIKIVKDNVENSFILLFNKHKSENNIVIIDPPRTGLHKNLALSISKVSKGISELYYLSCYPPTLARDLKIIVSNNNFCISEIHLFDMFPRTKHIEVLVKLNKTDFK